jgi:molybdate transport repressor ModE-like protein
MTEVRAKLWLEKDSKFILGVGRAEILRNIRDTGSISKAAKAMGMSYSHAWSEIREMSRGLGAPVIETGRGGRAGGSSRLTEAGKEILKKFEKEMEKMDRHLARCNE